SAAPAHQRRTLHLSAADALALALLLPTRPSAHRASSFKVNPGSYTVSEVLQSGWTQSFPAGGVYNITLTSGQIDSGNDFGNFRQATKTGIKFNDLDGDGVKDACEAETADLQIQPDRTGRHRHADHLSTVTGAGDGYPLHLSTVHGPGVVFSILVNPPSSTLSPYPTLFRSQSFPAGGVYNITLTSGQIDSGNDFGNFQQATKTGIKFNDLDGDGVKD